MNAEFRCVRGMSDIVGLELSKFRFIEKTSLEVAKKYGFSEVAVPIVEYSSLFERGLGSTSDIINKEMYTFQSKGGDNLTLRPEFTSSIARMFVGGGATPPAKIFSCGPLFRYERPQKGRKRQFHQINCEFVGSSCFFSDAEIISLACDVLKTIGINTEQVTLNINSLGDEESINLYRKKLVAFFKSHEFALSDDSKRRLAKNPLRILDSKNLGDISVLRNAPLISSCYTDASRKRFGNLLELLSSLNIKFCINERLVRGLDYYTGVVFEFITSELGSNGTVLAGGRYDNLISSMGGSSMPAIGFAAGLERLSEMLSLTYSEPSRIAVIPVGESCKELAFFLADRLRKNGFFVDFEYNLSMKARMKRAGNGCVVSVIFGADEIAEGVFSVRNMASGVQEKVADSNLEESLRSIVAGFPERPE